MIARAVPLIGEAGYRRIDLDAYRTPAWVTRHLLSYIKFEGLTWEPAAGDGDMFNVLANHGMGCIGTDIRGFCSQPPADFLSPKSPRISNGCRNIITNPPYDQAEPFIRRALAITEVNQGKVAMLLGHDYDSALKTRGDLFRHNAFAGKLMLPRRIRWVGFEDKASPRQIHAWYIWDWMKPQETPPRIIYPREATT